MFRSLDRYTCAQRRRSDDNWCQHREDGVECPHPAQEQFEHEAQIQTAEHNAMLEALGLDGILTLEDCLERGDET